MRLVRRGALLMFVGRATVATDLVRNLVPILVNPVVPFRLVTLHVGIVDFLRHLLRGFLVVGHAPMLARLGIVLDGLLL